MAAILSRASCRGPSARDGGWAPPSAQLPQILDQLIARLTSRDD
ncbi:MAG TPA: hypothetical protein VMF14_12855 [Solirubrobacteraceae bacterium]|nr:hypothetical protein [Solirubrobacteraceae bacterium]